MADKLTRIRADLIALRGQAQTIAQGLQERTQVQSNVALDVGAFQASVQEMIDVIDGDDDDDDGDDADQGDDDDAAADEPEREPPKPAARKSAARKVIKGKPKKATTRKK
jgi:nitric oxide reductase activation protein